MCRVFISDEFHVRFLEVRVCGYAKVGIAQVVVVASSLMVVGVLFTVVLRSWGKLTDMCSGSNATSSKMLTFAGDTKLELLL